MSYEKVKSIAINEKAGTVFITSACSNVSPQEYKRWQCTYLENMLQESGRDAVDAYILEQYQGGMMQDGATEYAQVVKLYSEINLENLKELRQLKKDNRGKKYIITHGQNYFSVITRSRGFLTPAREQAKKFSMVDALIKAKRFSGAQVISS